MKSGFLPQDSACKRTLMSVRLGISSELQSKGIRPQLEALRQLVHVGNGQREGVATAPVISRSGCFGQRPTGPFKCTWMHTSFASVSNIGGC